MQSLAGKDEADLRVQLIDAAERADARIELRHTRSVAEARLAPVTAAGIDPRQANGLLPPPRRHSDRPGVGEIGAKSRQTRADFLGSVERSGWWVITPTRVGPRARVYIEEADKALEETGKVGRHAREHLRLDSQRPLAGSEDRARDHEAVDLARPFVDLRDLGVAVIALDRKLLRVPVATENLDRLAGLAPRHLRREQLRLRAGLGVRLTLLLQPRRAIDE